MKKMNKKLSKLVALDKKIDRSHRPSPVEKQLIEAEQRFEATYYSNKLEGNRLTKHDARKAIFSE